MPPNVSVIQAVWYAFYNLAFYRQVLAKGKGINALYLALMGVILLVPNMSLLKQYYFPFNYHEFLIIQQHWPTVVIKQGKSHVSQATPLTIKSPQGEQSLIHIDPQLTSLSRAAQMSRFILFRHGFAVRKQRGAGYRMYRFPNNLQQVITKQDLQTFYNKFTFWLFVTVLPIALAITWMILLLLTSFFSIIVKGFAWFLGVPIKFTAALRLTGLSLTPSVVLLSLSYYCLSLEVSGTLGQWLLVLACCIPMCYQLLVLNSITNSIDHAR